MMKNFYHFFRALLHPRLYRKDRDERVFHVRLYGDNDDTYVVVLAFISAGHCMTFNMN